MARRLETALGAESEHYLLAAARALVCRVPAPALAATAKLSAAIPILSTDDAGDMSCGPCP
jgi:hypothetical protein